MARVQRLKTRPQFQAVMAGGVVARSPHFALHRLALAQPKAAETMAPPAPRAPAALFALSGEPWLGAMVPKRWARRAVTRNAIKRQVYSVCGALASCLGADVAYVVRLRSTFDRSIFVSASSTALKHAVRLELLQLMGRVLQPARQDAVAAVPDAAQVAEARGAADSPGSAGAAFRRANAHDAQP